MFARTLRRKPEPESPREPMPLWRRQLFNILETQIARYPFLVQIRAVWRQLQDDRQGWPVLIPALLLLFGAFYRVERRKVLRARGKTRGGRPM